MVPAARAHGLCLAGLVALCCLRVVGQLLADDWHSGLLPYPALVAAQLVIVAPMVRATRGVLRGTTRGAFHPVLAAFLGVLGHHHLRAAAAHP